MSNYLEGYGEGDARRSRVIRWLVLSALAIVIGGTLLYFGFRDYPQKRQVTAFLEKLRAQDHKAAYLLWCSETAPCPSYPYEEFMKDWGPQGIYRDATHAESVGSKSCEGGIIDFVRFPGQPDVLLWVDRRSDTLSFVPWKLRTLSTDFRGRFQAFLWDITRNCKPLLEQ